MQLDQQPKPQERSETEIDILDLKPVEDMDPFTVQALIDMQLMNSMDNL